MSFISISHSVLWKETTIVIPFQRNMSSLIRSLKSYFPLVETSRIMNLLLSYLGNVKAWSNNNVQFSWWARV